MRQLLDGYEPIDKRQAQSHREGAGGTTIIINNENKQQQGDFTPVSTTFNQNNYDNATGNQANAESGSTLYQADTLNIDNRNQTQILQLVTNLRQLASTFPQDLQDDLTIDIDDIETELKKPEDQRNPNKLKKRLLALAMAFSAIATPTAAMTDFTNNVTDLAQKAGIQLQLPDSNP